MHSKRKTLSLINIMTIRFKTVLTFLLAFCMLTGYAQTNNEISPFDTSLARKLTISGFSLCQATLPELQKLSNDFKPVEVEEMDLGKKCMGQDGRFENGKGYFSEKFPGMIFQKDQSTEQISKIRLTKQFKGNLPDGTPIDLQHLTLKDVFTMYPKLKNTWGSRGCSDYWHFSNDTLSFYVKIDPGKQPQFPIDEEYYYDKPIEAIDLVISCYSFFKSSEPYQQLLNDPVFFIDSVNVTRIELQNYKPDEIAVVSVYKDTSALKLVGEQGKYGAIYIETKKFARNKYWTFFKSRSAEYLQFIPTPGHDSLAAYILNGKVLKANYEGDLSGIDDNTFIDLVIIDKQKLKKDYNISGKAFGVVIRTKSKGKKG
jgi:hypothetical protein